MKYCILATGLALATVADAAKTTITLCTEKANAKAVKVVTALNADTTLNVDFDFKSLECTSPTDVITKFGEGKCNLVEFDAGKAFALATADKTSFPIAQEGSGSYETIAVVKKSKATTDGVKTFCDIIDKKYRACHTGFMKSAGWLSPMMNSLNCPAASVPTACAKKSATGAACHEALFGDSCVPGMYADIQGTAMTTGQMCKQCGTKGGKTADCSEAEYSNYNGAINGLMKDSCDVAFVKTVTIDCGAVDAGTFCKTGTAGGDPAPCIAAGTCDAKSVYLNNGAAAVAVAKDTYIRLKGYSTVMPSHVIMGGGMTTAQATKIMTTLPTHWKAEEGKDLTSKIGKTTTEILGKTFVESLDQVPFYYEKYKVIRPITVVDKDLAPTPAPSASAASGFAVASSAIGLILIAAMAAIDRD